MKNTTHYLSKHPRCGSSGSPQPPCCIGLGHRTSSRRGRNISMLRCLTVQTKGSKKPPRASLFERWIWVLCESYRNVGCLEVNKRWRRLSCRKANTGGCAARLKQSRTLSIAAYFFISSIKHNKTKAHRVQSSPSVRIIIIGFGWSFSRRTGYAHVVALYLHGKFARI